MFDFFTQLTIFASLGILLYLVARALPRIQSGEKSHNDNRTVVQSFISSLTLEKADTVAGTLIEKILRRLKIIILQADNFVTESLGKVKSKNGESDQHDDS